MSAPARPSEFDLIARYFAPFAGQGAFGLLDDAAALAPPPGCDLILTKDMVVADVHFFADDPWDRVAQKALRVNLSDLAAKGARPVGFLLGLGLPEGWREQDLAALARGLAADSAGYRCPLLGGDTVRASGGLTLSVTALGATPSGRMVRRTAAQAGDALYVTGVIGDAALGLQARLQGDAPWLGAIGEAAAESLRERYLLPEPRLALSDAVLAYARAAMDISDGFVGDLDKMLRGAGLGAVIPAEAIPLSAAAHAAVAFDARWLVTALTGGDDYELLCAIPSGQEEAFGAAAEAAGVSLSRLGVATAEPGLIITDAEGEPLALGRGSFAHF